MACGDSLEAALERAIARATHAPARVVRSARVGGGCIHDARRVELADGRRFFVKQGGAALGAMFEAEADGLACLASHSCFRIPARVAQASGARAFLVLEWIDAASAMRPRRSKDVFEEDFGRRLADMHRRDVGARFGFPRDNWLGATPQSNVTRGAPDWCTFWREHRLLPQLALAEQRGLGGAELQRRGHRLAERLEELLEEPAAPSLLHGDLWSGNYLQDEAGAPVLVDPACSFGHREAEFGMLSLFGGVGPRFYAAYEELAPFSPGATERIAIYRLHHLLNHLNLFGPGYLAQCMDVLRRYAG